MATYQHQSDLVLTVANEPYFITSPNDVETIKNMDDQLINTAFGALCTQFILLSNVINKDSVLQFSGKPHI
jgi:hypothetical protein